MAKSKVTPGFVPNMLPSSNLQRMTPSQRKAVQRATGPILTGRVMQVASAIDRVAPGMLNQVQDAVLAQGQAYVIDGINRIRNGKMPKALKSGSPFNPTLDLTVEPIFTGSGSSNTSYALSGSPSPKPVNLNSGVKPDTFVSDYMPPLENTCSPLHMTGINLALPTSTSHPLYQYILNNVVFNIQAKAQQVSSFLINIDPLDVKAFNAANIIAALNDGIYALQVYFYYSAILSYDSDSKNRNSGMDALRSLVDAQTLSDYIQLGKRLEDTPMPPKLVQFVRYISSNFKSGNNAGAPIIRTFFSPNAITGTRPAISFCSVALTNLSRNANLNTWTLMRKSFPKWRIGRLSDIPVRPLFDLQFLTIFANLVNAQRSSGTTVFNNTVSAGAINIAVPYNSYTNRLDGLAFTCGSIYDGTYIYPGFVNCSQVNSTYPDNRYSYYTVSSVSGFYPVYAYPFLGVSRQETSTQLSTTAYTPHLSGTDKCQNVTAAALLNSAQEVLDFMFETRTTLKLGIRNTFPN